MKTPSILAFVVLFGLVTAGCDKTPAGDAPGTTNDLRSPTPVAKGGIPDDSIKPVARTGIPDDSIKPVARTGIPDDSIKPVAKPGVTPVAPPPPQKLPVVPR